ncbi:MAG: glutamine--fructose-6-phosphate transaminase (isomerizing) [Christensenellales bacterium]
MCGIVGCAGRQPVAPLLIEGLKALEYRGYDSAGIALSEMGGLRVIKKKGRVSSLEDEIDGQLPKNTTGIGHTRWATHGEPSDENAHPHVSKNADIAVVHNGIIENYASLKRWLMQEGYEFRSETDTEVIAHLLSYNYKGDLKQAMLQTVSRLSGSYALAAVCAKEPGKIVCTRRESPLVVGFGQGENYLASDVSALIKHTRDVCFLGENDIAVVEADGIRLFDCDGNPVNREHFRVDWDISAAEKGGYEHFMLKEIFEQPRALKSTIIPRIFEGRIRLEGVDEAFLRSVKRIVICACGTAYHAGLVGKRWIESFARIPVEADIASEYRYRDPILLPEDLCIVVSQSGETADTIAALRTFKQGGGKVLCITNVVGSTVSRESDMVAYTWAGPEIAVASTKAYTTQLAVLFMLAMELGRAKGHLSDEKYAELLHGLMAVPDLVENALELSGYAQSAARRHFTQGNVFFIGRGLDQPATMESSLKLKEISYIHSEALPAGELKHGTIALIEKGTLVVAMSTQSMLREKLASNIKEVKARGAQVMLIAGNAAAESFEGIDELLPLPDIADELAPLISVVPAQLFAYYCATLRGFDPDKPRNLAKSVTVE